MSRGTRPLWWLGFISAAQAIVFAVLMTALAVPVALVPWLVVPVAPGQLAGSVDPQSAEAVRQTALIAVGRWLAAYWPPLVAVGVVMFALWIALGILDVAAQPGLITQATASVLGRSASVRAGLADGFRLWWRTVGLLVISALPSMLYLLAMSMVVFFTVSLPMLRGADPSSSAALTGNVLLSPLSTLVSVVSIPLAVWVQIALRFSVVDDLEVRPALRAAWVLIRRDLSQVALAYVVLAAIATVAFLPVTLVAGSLTAAAVAIVTSSAVMSGMTGVTSAGTIVGVGLLGVLVAAVVLVFSAAWFVYQSVAWTLFWRRFAGRENPAGYEPVVVPSHQ